MNLTPEQHAEWLKRYKRGIGPPPPLAGLRMTTDAAKPAKYRNVRKEIDGHVFDSSLEAKRYLELRALEAAGVISDLVLQPRFLLQAAFRDSSGRLWRKLEYVSDFSYIENGKEVSEDAKGCKTAVYRIKQKLAIQRYPEIEFREVSR